MRLKIFIAFIVLVGGVFTLIVNKVKEEALNLKVVNQKHNLEILIEGSYKLKRLWHEGDIDNLRESGKINCPFAVETSETFLRCNPQLIECFFSNYISNYNNIQATNYFTVQRGKKYHKIFARKIKGFDTYYRIITRANSEGIKIPSYAVLVEIFTPDDPSVSLKVLLEDSCNDVYLPRRIYGYGPYVHSAKENDWTWDNLNRSIYIDKYLVTVNDIQEWLKFGQVSSVVKKELSFFKNKSNISDPATGMKFEHMQRYCAFKGKQLLEAHVFDAATFYPVDLNKNREPFVFRSPYPETIKEKRSFMYKAQFDSGFVFKRELCRKNYTSECLETKFDMYDYNSISWTGMFHVLGGYLEVFNNPLERTKNLKASSQYFGIKSRWHQLGVRANWDGQKFRDRNFSWINLDTSNEIPAFPKSGKLTKLGFRCMKYVH